jgi:hypothetical protein
MPDLRRSKPRPCVATTRKGEPCEAAALHDGEYCYFHDPESAAAAAEARRQGGLRQAAEARRQGGLRRRQEAAVVAAYDLEDLARPQGLRRLLEISIRDTLVLPNSLARSRTLLAAITAGIRLQESIELESRLAALEAPTRIETKPDSGDWIKDTLLDRETDQNGRKR